MKDSAARQGQIDYVRHALAEGGAPFPLDVISLSVRHAETHGNDPAALERSVTGAVGSAVDGVGLTARELPWAAFSSPSLVRFLEHGFVNGQAAVALASACTLVKALVSVRQVLESAESVVIPWSSVDCWRVLHVD